MNKIILPINFDYKYKYKAERFNREFVEDTSKELRFIRLAKNDLNYCFQKKNVCIKNEIAFSGAKNNSQIIEKALNYKNLEQVRINAIKKFATSDFKELKIVFEKLLEAKHVIKIEFPEITNAVLDKLFEYKEGVETIIPSLEVLLGKDIFHTTKSRIYDLFIRYQPDNKIFLAEIGKSAVNPIEKILYKDKFQNLLNKSEILSEDNKAIVDNIYSESLTNGLNHSFVEKISFSRSCVNLNKNQKTAINNVVKAYNYIESKKTEKPSFEHLIEIHKIIFSDISDKEFLKGKLRTPENSQLKNQAFNIKKDSKNKNNPHINSKDVSQEMNKLEQFIESNYDNMDPFLLAANIFSELIRIHPFFDGNGRATRLFTEQFLLNKGYYLIRWPEETLYRKIHSPAQLSEYIKINSKPASF